MRRVFGLSVLLLLGCPSSSPSVPSIPSYDVTIVTSDAGALSPCQKVAAELDATPIIRGPDGFPLVPDCGAASSPK
jgi:hypothetical protein